MFVGAAGGAEGPAGRLMGLTRMRNARAGDDRSASDGCVCVCVLEERGPETSQTSRLDGSFPVLKHL